MALIDLITRDVVKVPLESTAKPDVIRELAQVLKDAGKIPEVDSVFDALMAREARGSTGLEMGIAVPHAKTDAVPTLTMAIGIAPNGIDFDSFDGEPSRIFFLLLATNAESGPHIEALAEVARITKSRSFLNVLAGARTAAEVVELFAEE